MYSQQTENLNSAFVESRLRLFHVVLTVDSESEECCTDSALHHVQRTSYPSVWTDVKSKGDLSRYFGQPDQVIHSWKLMQSRFQQRL